MIAIGTKTTYNSNKNGVCKNETLIDAKGIDAAVFAIKIMLASSPHAGRAKGNAIVWPKTPTHAAINPLYIAHGTKGSASRLAGSAMSENLPV